MITYLSATAIELSIMGVHKRRLIIPPFSFFFSSFLIFSLIKSTIFIVSCRYSFLLCTQSQSLSTAILVGCWLLFVGSRS
jgi:hypothetical protein